MSNTIYTYKNCKLSDFSSDITFKEEEFSKILQSIYETQLNVETIKVSFELVSHPEHKKLNCTIDIESSKLKFNSTESGFEYSEIVRKNLHKAVEAARRVKGKVVDSK